MIVVDTSALIAVLQSEAGAERIEEILVTEDQVFISAVTLTEALIVSLQKNLRDELEKFLLRINIEIIPLDGDDHETVVEAYSIWGKGINPARLNFGDCFAYALANMRTLPLLYVGNDFARTDIVSAMER